MTIDTPTTPIWYNDELYQIIETGQLVGTIITGGRLRYFSNKYLPYHLVNRTYAYLEFSHRLNIKEFKHWSYDILDLELKSIYEIRIYNEAND